MFWVNVPVIDIIHPQSSMFVMDMKTKATGDSELNDSPGNNAYSNICLCLTPN